MFAAETSVNSDNLEEIWLYIYCLFFTQFFVIVVSGAASRIEKSSPPPKEICAANINGPVDGIQGKKLREQQNNSNWKCVLLSKDLMYIPTWQEFLVCQGIINDKAHNTPPPILIHGGYPPKWLN